jgi:hypothetical protein
LSEISRNKFRNANIGVAVGGFLALLAAILFEDEALLEASAAVAFASAMAVFLYLDDREYRSRTRDEHQRSP